MAEWIVHCVICAAFLVGFWCIEALKKWLWGAEEKLLWGVLPLQHVFDTADFAIIGFFLLFGSFQTIRTYLGK